MEKRARISVRGVVQGVGFRPFVYRLAHEQNLTGWVRNTSGSVEIEAEGDEDALADFLVALKREAPPRSRVETIEASYHPVKGDTDFVIRESHSHKGARQLISPDIATCEDCKREIFSSENRRFAYPFTNCTNCGPRFTIIEDIPYDRAKTTMSAFVMCSSCQQEYDDPLDRRFHAQPNACSACGPALKLVDRDGAPLACEDPLGTVSRLLREGNVIAVKGLGGFHLVCDTTDEAAVNLLRERKKRPSKPLAVMIGTLAEAEEHCTITQKERELLSSPEAPIVLLRWKKERSRISSAVAPKQRFLGVMLPYTPLHHILLRKAGIPLVMTSGNLSGEPLVKGNDEALEKLRGVADYFLLHNREIHTRCDDSVCLVEEVPRVVRRARGYAPDPIHLPFKSMPVLASGAEFKNTICLAKDEHAFLSQHIGDMGNEETLEHFYGTIGLYEHLFRIDPEIIVCDMHPDYTSSKAARELASKRGLQCVTVQHHHAHIVSGLVDNGIEGPVIGVAFDGTGYGTDGAIWGGEFLLADFHTFERVAHLEYVPLPGGEAAIKKPYRMALSYLYTLLGEDVSPEGLPLQEIDPVERDVIVKQLRKGINAPLTSSAGRLFDAVSALLGVQSEIDYDAQAAIELEMLAWGEACETGLYPLSIDEEGSSRVVRLGGLFSAITQDVRKGVSPATIAYGFHRTIADGIARVCASIAKERGIDRVLLSGGVFQNRLLLRLTMTTIEREGLRVFTHRYVPGNDGGISLGQAVVAHFASNCICLPPRTRRTLR
jgi:hydrogenase maturation protein HypF